MFNLVLLKDIPQVEVVYDEKDKLGEGAFGDVYKGYLAREEKQAVAIKRVSGSLEGMSAKDEALILTKLDHPHIIKMYGIALKEVLYIVTELLGKSVEYTLFHTSHLLPLSKRIQIALDIAEAVLYIHKLNIIHRDISLGNVLIALDGNGAKLIDFGLAGELNSNGVLEENRSMGTPGYLAPELDEQYEPDRVTYKVNPKFYYTKATDVFALAIFCSELVEDISFSPQTLKEGLYHFRSFAKQGQNSIPEARPTAEGMKNKLNDIKNGTFFSSSSDVPTQQPTIQPSQQPTS